MAETKEIISRLYYFLKSIQKFDSRVKFFSENSQLRTDSCKPNYLLLREIE